MNHSLRSNGFRRTRPVLLVLSAAFAILFAFGAQEADSADEAWVPAPLSADLRVKAAFNRTDVFWRFEWPEPKGHFIHDVLVYEGGTWVARGDAGGGPDPDGLREDRISFMIDAGEVPGFANQGCYVTCHTGLPSMSDEVGADTILAGVGAQRSHQVPGRLEGGRPVVGGTVGSGKVARRARGLGPERGVSGPVALARGPKPSGGLFRRPVRAGIPEQRWLRIALHYQLGSC